MNDLVRARTVIGNLLEAPTKYIAHQTNCVTRKSAHLSAAVFKRFPYANVYETRPPGFKDTPGTIVIKGNGGDQRFVINMMGQFAPGKPRNAESPHDGFAARRDYFVSCLRHVLEIDNLGSVAFPHGIGCGAAGGDWRFYEMALHKLAQRLHGRAEVLIYKLR